MCIEQTACRFDSKDGPALNTDGGGMSSNHPGMRGIFLLIDATRQLRGESTSQVKDAKLAVARTAMAACSAAGIRVPP